MEMFNFIGYFILVLLNLPHVQISQVLSVCCAIPTSLLLSQDSDLVCFLLLLLPATLFPPLMFGPPRVREHHLDLGVCISTESLPVWPFPFYHGLQNHPYRP
jgi:hypothetical protein